VGKLSIRVRAWWDDLRDSLWVLPSLTVLVSVGTAALVVEIDGHLPEAVRDLTFGGTPEGARAILSELAGATFTVTGVVFSLTIVALQMASSQFTPRLLRTFLRDRRTQWVLSGMLGSGVFDVAVLRTVRSGEGDAVIEFVPQLAVSLALVYALGAVALLVYFLHHLTRHMRVDVIMHDIRGETLTQLQRLRRDREALPDLDAPAPPSAAVPILAKLPGYLQTVDVQALSRAAERFDVVVRLRPTMGAWVSRGTTVAWVWGVDGDAPAADPGEVASAVHGGLHLGSDRTESDDLAFGLRQIADIAIRALSPGVNDPTTAVQALGQLSAILVELADHPLGADSVEDERGRIRASVPRADFGQHLDLAIAQIRDYGAGEPAVLVAICELLTDVAERVADTADRSACVRDQLDRTRRASQVVDPVAERRVANAVRSAARTLERGHRSPRPTEAG
jgi:uncharacterized membrane protein